MKYIFFLTTLLLVFFSTSQLSAQRQIALHHNGTQSYYTEIDSAYEQALDGDTVYLPGGPFALTSGEWIIDKRLTILGVGYRVDSSYATQPTQLIGSVKIKQGGSYGTMQGVFVSHEFILQDTVQYYRLLRCKIFEGLYLNSNCKHNLFIEILVETGGFPNHSVWGQNSKANEFHNCIFGGEVLEFQAGTIFSHCIFGYNSFAGVAFSTFQNCIFTAPNYGTGFQNQFNTYANCIFASNYNFTGGSADFGNLLGVDITTVFESFGAGNYLANDFHLKANSPALGAGIGGVDCGIYAGPFGFKDNRHPSHPRIRWQVISTGTDVNGNLPVLIEVEAQKH